MSESTLKAALDNFYGKRWGVFNHYLYGVQNNPGSPLNMNAGETSWEECTEALDVERIASNLRDMGAGYYFFTLMQGRKFMAAPNATFDEITGTKPGEACCKRDLVNDLYAALSKYGIDLYLYYTGDGPYKDEECGKRFNYIDPRNENLNETFIEKWAAVLEEYAVRYGSKVKGWWVDGCYKYFKYNDERLTPYYKACKAGNPDSLVSFNDGVKQDYAKHYVNEEFVCGEFNDFVCVPKSRFIDGAQAHILAPLGKSPDGNEWGAWARPGIKRSREYMRDYINRVHDAGGVVTVDIALFRDGSFDPEQMDAIRN